MVHNWVHIAMGRDSKVHINIYLPLSTARSRADAPLQAVSWCLLPVGPWSITAALPWRTEDWRPQQTAILRNVVRKPRIGEAQCTVGPRLTQPSPGNISPCHEALLRTSQRKRNNINHITSIFIFQFHSTYIKYDLDIEIGLLIILTASTARACTLYPCLDNM